MKKLLIFMLVLGLASASYGAYGDVRDDFELDLRDGTLYVVGLVTISGDSISVGVYDPSAETDGLQYSGSGSTLGSPVTAGAINYLMVWHEDDYDGLDFDAGSTGLENPAHDAAIGDWYSVAYSGDVGDMMDIYDWDVSWETPVGQLPIIPEPTTIALLGLGGLFLLRRRR